LPLEDKKVHFYYTDALSSEPEEYNLDEDPILQVHLDMLYKAVHEIVDEVFNNIVEKVLKGD
jgi:hypothetical protein